MKNKKPFFAKFLENQISEIEIAKLKGGCIDDLHDLTTRKAPSDWEEDMSMTKKAPSDCEDL
jgi:hypothetical protein